MSMDFSADRLSYEKGELIEDTLPQVPLSLFQAWLQQAIEQKVIEPYAMSLATCGADGQPSVRTVLLREVTDKPNGSFGLTFYTNYDSDKGQAIAENPKAQVLFFWHSLERQVRLSGQIQKLSSEQSQAYFAKRPHDSQIAAWVSEPQSGIVSSRQVMEDKFLQLIEQYPEGSHVPMPDFWGGYELIVESVEFWQGRANRMHDRILYTLQDSDWQIQRLLP